MFNTLRHNATLFASMATIMFGLAAPALSQAPTDAQRSAIRSNCRADYQAHCSSIPPGGAESLQCLQKNMASLSAGCQGAVRAVEPPATPKAEAAPAAAPKEDAAAAPKTETAPAAAAKPAEAAAPAGTTTKQPSTAQVAAIRNSCRSDYQKVCAGVPTGGQAALQCLEKNKANVSSACQQAVNAASGGTSAAKGGASAAATTAAAPAAAPVAAPAPVLVLRPMRPREELFVLRSACGGDVRALCGGIPPGGGRIIQCLASQAASISPACKEVLGQFAAQ
jgi:hypothetical protein